MLVDVDWHDPVPLDRFDKKVVKSVSIQPHAIRYECDFTGVMKDGGPETHHCRFIRLEKGVYVSHLNFEHEVNACSKQKVVRNYDGPIGDPFSPFRSYGVADNLKQIKDEFHRFWSVEDRQFFLELTVMYRAYQPPDGGWRWHKWGTYIGTLNPRFEYLYDEPHIRRSVCFSFHELKRGDGR